MTNATIILNASFELMEQGIIGTTGRIIEVQLPNGERKQMQEPEQIHTFAFWKARGYSVKKGEKAIAVIRIWNHSVKQIGEMTVPNVVTGETITEPVEEEKMFMKNAYFFKFSQVEPSKPRKKIPA